MKNGGGGEFSPPYFVKQEMGAVMERLIELLDRLDYQVPGLERAGNYTRKRIMRGVWRLLWNISAQEQLQRIYLP